MAKQRFSITRCRLPGVEAVAADTAQAFGRHMHAQYGIGLILRGAQKSLSGRGMVQAEAGDVITVNPGEVHDGTPIGEHGRAWRMLYFEPAALAGAMTALTDGATHQAELSHPALRHAACAARFGHLFRAMTAREGGDSEMEATEHLLLLLVTLIDRRPPERLRHAPGGIQRARHRIDDDPAAPLSLGELARIGGISPFQLVRGFAKATGLTPHAYLVQRRLHKARQLIASGLPLADAAQAAGFADQSHMTRLFVRSYGLSPGVYAAAMR